MDIHHDQQQIPKKGEFLVKLKGRTCIVTGGARGIGFETAKTLSEYGADVVIADVNEEGALNAAKRIAGGSHGIGVDVSDVSRLEKMMNDVAKRYGKIDVVVNNAGILQTSKIEDITEEEWNKMVDINLKSAFFVSQKALPYMKKNRFGRIINISSLAGRNGGFEANCVYAISKAGMIGMTRNIARRVAPFGITVNAVAPGTTESEMSRQFSDEAMKKILSVIPMKRLGKPREIAETVAFLASDKAGFITGAVIDINGGMFMG